MAILRTFLVISMLAAVAPAVVKREEYQPSDHSGNAHMQSAPVYNGPSMYSQKEPNSFVNAFANTHQLLYNQQHPNGPAASPISNANYPEAAASNVQPNTAPLNSPLNNGNNGQGNGFQPQPNQQQPNLYYYYYPVQADNNNNNNNNNNKPKDTYQAQPSNQYSSQVQPNAGNPQSMHSGHDDQNNNQNNPNPGHDLNYGAQDLSYTASMNENGNQGGNQHGSSQGNGNAPFDSSLTNLASSLQQYGFGSNNGAGQGFGAFSNQFGNFGNLGESFGASQMQSPFSNEAFAAAVNQLGGNFGNPGSGPSNNGGSSSAPSGLSALYQQASQMYQGLLGGGNQNSQTSGASGNPYAAASQAHPAYEASAPSSYRSKYGLGTIIMPMLALAGLSLLIPTVSSLSTVASRKKRSTSNSLSEFSIPTAAGSISNYIDRIERYYALYKTAVEREECMNRILCELGDAVSNVRGKQAFFSVMEKMAPTWMGSKVNVFKSGALGHENGKCKKYHCN